MLSNLKEKFKSTTLSPYIYRESYYYFHTLRYFKRTLYKKNDWQNRNRIKTAQGWQWLTVPVHYRFPQKIAEVPLNNQVNWNKKHLQALTSNYSRAPFFNRYWDIFKQVYAKTWDSLSELNIYFFPFVSHFFYKHR